MNLRRLAFVGAALATVALQASPVAAAQVQIDPAHNTVTLGGGSSGVATTPGSSTQAIGGTAQALFSGATPAHGWKVAIPTLLSNINSFVCFVSDESTTPSAAQQGSYPIYAGGYLSTEPGQLPAGPVYVNCPTTGQAISAQRW